MQILTNFWKRLRSNEGSTKRYASGSILHGDPMTLMRILIDDVCSRFRVLPKKRIFPFATAVRVGFIFLVVFGFITAGSARERGPVSR
jgi:hypothetical protein